MTWRTRAACNDPAVEPEWFFAEDRGFFPVEAMRVCAGCPVRLDCLLDALKVSTSDDSGVWGGTTPNNRNEVRLGRMSAGRAMALGDRIAGLRTRAEQAADGAAA